MLYDCLFIFLREKVLFKVRNRTFTDLNITLFSRNFDQINHKTSIVSKVGKKSTHSNTKYAIVTALLIIKYNCSKLLLDSPIILVNQFLQNQTTQKGSSSLPSKNNFIRSKGIKLCPIKLL